MILITGATGHLGSSIISQLLKTTTSKHFVALARDEKKATLLKDNGVNVRMGDFDEAASLANAFAGIDKLLLISTMDQNRFTQHKNVIDAAVQAGVQHIIYTGLAIKNIETSGVRNLMISHFETEDYIKAKGLTYTFLRNTMYADAIPQIVGENFLERSIFLPGGDGKVPYALRREMGEAIANLLLQNGHENKTYNITGSKAYSYQDIANELEAITGKEVEYIDADATIFPSILKEAGVPEFPIYLLAGTVADIKNHQYEIESNELATLLGRATASLRVLLKEVYQLK